MSLYLFTRIKIFASSALIYRRFSITLLSVSISRCWKCLKRRLIMSWSMPRKAKSANSLQRFNTGTVTHRYLLFLTLLLCNSHIVHGLSQSWRFKVKFHSFKHFDRSDLANIIRTASLANRLPFSFLLLLLICSLLSLVHTQI